jgi:uncharacterized protein YbbC (DUF1343 family)
MTVGELAELFRYERQLELDLQVIKLEGWRRGDFFDQTGLYWVNPSPNMRCLNQALLYPGIGLLETTNISVGRGTDTPFEVIGAPWVDGRRLARAMNASDVPGIRFVPIRFTPSASKHAGQPCGGIAMVITDRKRLRPLQVGLEIARQLRQLYPEDWDVRHLNRLLGNNDTLQAVLERKTIDAIMAGYRPQLDAFRVRRAAWLLYGGSDH